MAMTIDGVTMPNPVSLDADSVAIAATNLTYGGPKSYYHSQSTTARQGLHVLKVVWDNLNTNELSDVVTAFQAAADEYVTLTFDDIELPATFVTPDEVTVIVYPGTVLDIEYQQGYDSAGNGPLLYTVGATFVTGPRVL